MTAAANRPPRWALPFGMRALLVLGFLLAIAATVLVVFSEQVRWLRFAVLLGLWAALIAAFVAARSRRDTRYAEQRAEDGRVTDREELAGLREQLDRLNTTLSGLLDGGLLFERLTLSAESTRVRPVGDSAGSRLSTMAHSGQIQSAVESVEPFASREAAAPSPPDAPDGSVTAVAGPTDPTGPQPSHQDGTGHSSGISVAELVAAYGTGQAVPHRRRRAQD